MLITKCLNSCIELLEVAISMEVAVSIELAGSSVEGLVGTCEGACRCAPCYTRTKS